MQSPTVFLVQNLQTVLNCPQYSVRHPSAHIVIVHMLTNDVMHQLESLAVTIQSMGKTCIFLAPSPLLQKDLIVSAVYSLHEWLKYFCNATGHGFISNFDYFWNRHDLYKPNLKGTKKLQNFIQHIAFNFDWSLPRHNPASETTPVRNVEYLPLGPADQSPINATYRPRCFNSTTRANLVQE